MTTISKVVSPPKMSVIYVHRHRAHGDFEIMSAEMIKERDVYPVTILPNGNVRLAIFVSHHEYTNVFSFSSLNFSDEYLDFYAEDIFSPEFDITLLSPEQLNMAKGWVERAAPKEPTPEPKPEAKEAPEHIKKASEYIAVSLGKLKSIPTVSVISEMVAFICEKEKRISTDILVNPFSSLGMNDEFGDIANLAIALENISEYSILPELPKNAKRAMLYKAIHALVNECVRVNLTDTIDE